MFGKALAAVTLSLAFLLPITVTESNAQNRLERLAVPDAKLHDTIWKKNDPNSSQVVDHSAFNAFLDKYLTKDRNGVALVRYSSVSNADKQNLRAYINTLQSTDVTTLNRNEQFAFWVNLYNALAIDVTLQNYPVESIRDIKNGLFDFSGPFDDDIATVNGKTLTLNTIESGIVRPLWPDPRLHYVFNCAAITCPNLGDEALSGKTLDKQLDAAAFTYVNDPRAIRVEDGKLIASKIFFWYEDDFGGNEAGILNHLRQYARGDVKAMLDNVQDIDSYEYDWSLNDAR